MCGRSAAHAENDHAERRRFALNAMYPGADVVVVVVFGPARDAERTRHVNSARALDCGPRQCGDATLPRVITTVTPTMRSKQQKYYITKK